jgi:hypothetical protein
MFKEDTTRSKSNRKIMSERELEMRPLQLLADIMLSTTYTLPSIPPDKILYPHTELRFAPQEWSKPPTCCSTGTTPVYPAWQRHMESSVDPRDEVLLLLGQATQTEEPVEVE